MRTGADPVRTTVVVLAYRKAEFLEACLRSLAAHQSRFSFEVVVVADGATPEVEAVIRDAEFSLVWSPAVRNLAAACNVGVANSSAELLVLLHADAEPEAGWLDALVDAVDDHPDVGLVAGLVLSPDGTVRDSGGVVWHDGSTTMIGVGARPDHPDLRTAGLIDYSAANAVLVRRRTWDEIGGMEEGEYPARYEGINLCLRLRARGWKIWLSPAARVLHAASAGTDSASGAAPLLPDETRFWDKWRDVLEHQSSHRGHPEQNLATAVAAARRRPRRVLVVDDRAPAPGLGGGFGRMWDIVESLSRSGVQVTILATVSAVGNPDLDRLGVSVVSDASGWLNDPSSLVSVAIVSRPNNAHIVDLIRESQPWATVLYDAEALFHRRLQRELEFAVDVDRRAAIHKELASITPIEASLRSRFDGIIAISLDEQEWLRSQPGDSPVSLIDPGVPPKRIDRPTLAARRGAVFVAGWVAGPDSPNADGLRWFARHVLPTVRSRLPECVVLVTGDAPPSLRRFASPWLRFTGQVPDLDELYASVRVAIAPIRFGSGVKIKTVEALLRGVPVVATQCGAEGVADELLLGARIADDALDFANHVVELLVDDQAWTTAHTHLRRAARPEQPNRRTPLAGRWLAVLDRAQEARS